MSPGPQGTSLGVDFGTSHTIAVVRRADGSVRPLLFDGAPLMPSAVCADPDGGLLVGRDAVHSGRRHPERFEPNPKRLIDRPSTLLGEREYQVADLIAAVLDAVADECRRVVGHPAQVTLTVPAEWGPARRRVVEDAAARSGLGQVRLVPEPVAAATYYAEALKHRMAVGASIVVYDLGAGTFDASVVRRTGDGFETVALDGRSDLGGLDIDAALIEHLGVTYGTRDGWKRLINPTTIEERRHFREFQEEVRSAKERLSRHQQADIAIPLLDVEAHLTRTELERIAAPHLEQTIRVTQAVIRSADLDVADSAGVFLVGGASRMPLVATMLHRSLGLAPTVLDQPEVVVAEGSVLWTQAGPGTATFPLQYPATPAASAYAPTALTPHASPQQAPPHTEPAAPQQLPSAPYRPTPQAAPSPQEARNAAPVSPPGTNYQPPRQDPGRALPPRAQQTPPVAVSGGDDPPPRTEAQRLRARRVGRRLIAGFIAVDLVIIAGLAWYFNRDNGDDDSGGSFDVEAGGYFDADWDPAVAGTMVSEAVGAHDGAVISFAAVDTEDGQMLFSAESDGTIKQWSMDAGDLVSTYTVEDGIDRIEATATSEGEPMIVAVDHGYSPHVWTPSTQEFRYSGTPELAGDVGRIAVGIDDGTPVLGILNEESFELFGIEGGGTFGVSPIPGNNGWPNFFTSTEGGYTGLVAVDPSHRLSEIDSSGAGIVGYLDDTGDWPEDVAVAALRVVYYDGAAHAMMLGEDETLYFWNLETYEPAFNPVLHAGAGDRFHDRILDTEAGPAFMYVDAAADAYLQDFAASEPMPLDSATTGDVTGLEDLTANDQRIAVTGDADGNIQFWSLGL
ncbi:Hsp70 family protein [Glycomyces harbinensis]|uniref:Hsp70 protein n=1 Tax=Glycomyces harbinensis TaxID=58114 RepID=A0A1G6VQ54_9ACTN|nr:Hsp70 family protein [Glycomyces harbinensis]SDD55671.1 Hsp70 protein [Glycomyces harbinensis]